MSAAKDKAVDERKKEVEALQIWSNSLLGAKGIKITNLEEDFSNGVNLINLLLAIYKDKEVPQFNHNPKNEPQKLDNLSVALDFIKAQKINLVSVSAIDIVNKKTKAITYVLWNILRENTVRNLGVEVSNKPPKDRLLAWVQGITKPVNCEVTDFWASWVDGRAFYAVVSQLTKNKLDIGKIESASSEEERLEAAFGAAEANLHVPRMFKATDFKYPAVPDEEKLENYVSLLLSATHFGPKDSVDQVLQNIVDDSKQKAAAPKEAAKEAPKESAPKEVPKEASKPAPAPAQNQNQQQLIIGAVLAVLVLLYLLTRSSGPVKSEL